MDIPALSVMLSQSKVQQQASLSVMQMTMGVAADQGQALTEQISETAKSVELAAQPHLGANVDISA